MTPTGDAWSQADLVSLREAIRLRPALYVGDVTDGTGVMSLLAELVDNVVDLHFAGECTHGDIRLHADGAISVVDDGPGLPIEETPAALTFIEAAFTGFHRDSLRKNTKNRPPERPMLFGLGLPSVNHFSSWVDVEIFRGGARYAQRFVDGAPKARLSCEGPSSRTGTRISFMPDPVLFTGVRPSFRTVTDFLQCQAVLSPGLVLTLYEETSGHSSQAYAPEGLLSCILQRFAESGEMSRTGPIFQTQGVLGGVDVRVVLGWSGTTTRSRVDSFANLRRTEGGSHVDELLETVNDVFDGLVEYREGGLASRPRGENNPVRHGLVAVVDVRAREAVFSGAAREVLASPEIGRAVRHLVSASLRAFFDAHPALVRAILRACGR